jgi:hypothetical protein
MLRPVLLVAAIALLLTPTNTLAAGAGRKVRPNQNESSMRITTLPILNCVLRPRGPRTLATALPPSNHSQHATCLWL